MGLCSLNDGYATATLYNVSDQPKLWVKGHTLGGKGVGPPTAFYRLTNHALLDEGCGSMDFN